MCIGQILIIDISILRMITSLSVTIRRGVKSVLRNCIAHQKISELQQILHVQVIVMGWFLCEE